MGLSFKLFRKQRQRVLLGIFGVAISAFLISSIAFLNDSLSAASLDIITDQVGAGDVIFSRRTSYTVGDEYQFPENEIQQALGSTVPELEGFYPRITEVVAVEGVVGREDQAEERAPRDYFGSLQTQVLLTGIDVDLENRDGLGRFLNNSEVYRDSLRPDHCFLTVPAATLLNVTVGDVLQLRYVSGIQNWTIQAVLDHEEKFTFVERNLIVLNLAEAQEFLHRTGNINMLIGRFANSEQYYNTRDLGTSLRRLREIGMQIDAFLPEEYDFYMLKLAALNATELVFIPLSVFYWFVTIISMIVTGLLIYGVISTSSEELIYEMGMLRVIGSHKRKTYKILLFQGVVVSIVGTTLGLVASMAFSPVLLEFLFTYVTRLGLQIPLTIFPETILQSYLLIFTLVVGISLIPARRAANRVITQAINPFRSQETKYHVTKAGSPNLKMVTIGVAISVLGVLFFIVVPSFVATLDFFLLLMTFLVLLILMLVGLVMVMVVLVPFIERGLLKLASRFNKRSHHVIRMSLKRYQRRNLTTTLMFAFSFTFIFFIGAQINVLQETVTEFFDYQYGTDLVMSRTSDGDGEVIDPELVTQLEAIEHVDRVVPVMHNSLDLTLLLNGELGELQRQLGGGGLPRTTVGDYINYHHTTAGLIGVPREFVEIVDASEVVFDGGGASWEEAFGQLFTENDSCLLSRAVADFIAVDVGETLRLTVINGTNHVAHEFVVRGIIGRVPGFWNFRQSWYSTYSGGVMMAVDTYRELFGLTGAPVEYDKIFVDCGDASREEVQQVQTQIEDATSETYQYVLDDNYSKTVAINRQFDTFSTIMEIILFFTVLVSIFGIFSSTQNKVLERRQEIGILRALGLRKGETRNMFILEAAINLLASGFLGTLIGLALTWIIKYEITYLLEIPFRVVVPWVTVGWVFGVAIAVGVGGLFALLYRHFERPPLEFFHRAS